MGYGICASNVSDTTYINLKSSTLRYSFENGFLYPAKSYYLLHVKLNQIEALFIHYFQVSFNNTCTYRLEIGMSVC